MTENIPEVVVLVVGVPLFLIGFYLWFQAARHMIGLLSHFKPNMWWGQYIPICIFIPHFFTEEGNRHRLKMLKYAGLFIVFCGTPFLAYAIWSYSAR